MKKLDTEQKFVIIMLVVTVILVFLFLRFKKKKPESNYAGVYGNFGNESSFSMFGNEEAIIPRRGPSTPISDPAQSPENLQKIGSCAYKNLILNTKLTSPMSLTERIPTDKEWHNFMSCLRTSKTI